MKRLIILIFVLSFSPVLRADLKPVFLSIKLSSPKSTYINGEILPFSVEFQNKDVGKRPVILPGNQKEGKKIIYFSFFSVKDNFYSEVYREATEIAMDTLTKGWVDFRYLKAGEKFSIPVIFNDEKNFSQHIEAHHKLPNLPIGEYQVLAWYQPWTNELSPYAFNPISDFKQTETLRDSTRFDIPIEGTQSNYLTINISNTYQETVPFVSTLSCTNTCGFCAAIEDQNWKEVERIIHQQTYYEGLSGHNKLDSNWRMQHRNVAWLGPEPQAILLSLPTFTSRTIIFLNKAGYHYYTMTWQLGKVYRVRSRIGMIFHYLGFRSSPIKSSEVDYCELIYFKPY